MQFRRLGRTGLSVSEYTIGTSALHSPDLDRAEASAMIALAIERGINAVEIEASHGEAAGLLGEIMERERAPHRLHIFSRATSLVPFELPSPHISAQQAYPGWHIRAETEALLRTLGVERLALLQLHAWCPEWLHEGDWLETLERLREEGTIAGFGVSLFDHDVEAALEIVGSGTIDSVQVMYNVFDQGAAAALLPLCFRHDIGVIARSPFYYGALASPSSGDVRAFPPGDWRRDYFFDEHRRETGERVRRLAHDVAPPDHSVSDLALRFCLSHPAVSTVAVGMRTRAQLEANLRALLPGSLDKKKLESLEKHAWLC